MKNTVCQCMPFNPNKLRSCCCNIGNWFLFFFFPAGTRFQKLVTRQSPISFPGFSPNRPFRGLCERESLVGSGPESGDIQINDLGEEQISARFVSTQRSQVSGKCRNETVYLTLF